MIKGDFHVVEYLGWETTYTEIVPSDRCVVTIHGTDLRDFHESMNLYQATKQEL